jgi:RNA polymerase sigma-70 factor, ECF subfamily
LGLSHAEAEDVLHETFGALMLMKQPPRDAGNYCVRAFRNRVLNYRRGWLRRWLRELESRRWFEHEAHSDPREGAMMQRLASLPVEQREVIVLKIWHGRTFREIAELTDTSPNTVASRYRYGLAQLRQALEGETDELRGYCGRAPEWLDPATPIASA